MTASMPRPLLRQLEFGGLPVEVRRVGSVKAGPIGSCLSPPAATLGQAMITVAVGADLHTGWGENRFVLW